MVFLRWSASISHVSRYLKKPFPFGYFPNFEQIMPETKLRRRLIGAAIACLIAVWGCLTILYSQAIGNRDFVVLIILCFLPTIITAIGLIINYRLPKKQHKPFMESVVFTILSFILVGIILSFPRAEISSNLEQRTLDQNADGLDPNTVELIKQEHQKAVNEILERTKADDSWLKNKFILVGGLFAAFLAYTSTFVASIDKDDDFAQKLTSHIGKIFTTSLPISVLGLACVVSLAIDFHLRNNAMVTKQLGLWIQTYVEHTLNKASSIYTGWETFLRTEYPEKEGMHRDILFSIINGAHFYFT